MRGGDGAKSSEAGGRGGAAGSSRADATGGDRTSAQRQSKAPTETARGCGHPAAAGLENWLSSGVMEVRDNWTLQW